MQPFIAVKSRRLASGAAGNEEIDPGLDLPGDQVAQGVIVDGAVLSERSYKCRATATQVHVHKISRMGRVRERLAQIWLFSLQLQWPNLHLPPHILEVVEAFSSDKPFR